MLMVSRVKTKSNAAWTKIQRVQNNEILEKNTKEIQKPGNNGVRLADSQADTFTKQLPIKTKSPAHFARKFN